MMKFSLHHLKSQMVANVATAVCAFFVGMCIRFFVTPYVVRHLGVEAYGFVGVSENILGITSIFTIAVNSMAGRFIAVECQKGDMESARSFYSSVFFVNIFFVGLLGLMCLVVGLNLESIVAIPQKLVVGVKILFTFLTVNMLVGLLSSVWWIGAFVRNRLDLTNGISVAGNLLQAITLFALFSLGAAHIWYIGAAILAMGVFVAGANYFVMRRMIPEVKVAFSGFDLQKIVTLVKSGSWNLVSKLSDILGQGVDLLIANLFIGATLTGILAITKNIPFILLGFFATVSASFSPMLLKRYAEKSHSQFMMVLGKAIRIDGMFAIPCLVCLFLLGNDFYALWMPGQNARLLQTLTILGVANMVFAMPLEPIWTVFTAMNKLKWPTLFMLGNSIVVLATMFAGCVVFEAPMWKLVTIAGARAAWGIVRSITFLPIYGAAILGVPKTTFYGPLWKGLSAFAVCVGAGHCIKPFLVVDTWLQLFIVAAGVGTLTLAISAIVYNWDKFRRCLPVIRGKSRMIHFVHRMDEFNSGDMASCPRKYFAWPLSTKVHDIDNLDFRWFRPGDVLILGGGGLFDCLEQWNVSINKLLDTCELSVCWGCGFNASKGTDIQTTIDLGRFSLIAIRDYNHSSGAQWLPCPSCMAIDDSIVGSIAEGVGIVSHRDMGLEGVGDRILNCEMPEKVIDFISQHETIKTNSYHAAYWAMLLEKEVVLKGGNYSSKFLNLKPIPLREAKEMNVAFYERVIKAISA